MSMLVPDGTPLESLGVLPGCAFTVTSAEPVYRMVLPWKEIVWLRLTINQQCELATEKLVILPVLHFTYGEQVGHEHLIALALDA